MNFLGHFPNPAENRLHRPLVWDAEQKLYRLGPEVEDPFVFKWNLVLVLILRTSVKALQNVVTEALSWRGVDGVTASAFSQARSKLEHEALIELNRTAVVETLYSDGPDRRFWGFRGLGVDGSKLVLPHTEEVCREFGTRAYSNGKTAEIHGERP